MAEPPPIEQQATPSDPYPALGEPLAIELANTLFTDRGRPLDALTKPAALSHWLKTNADSSRHNLFTARPRAYNR
jgi:hypothetical protein